MHEAAPDFFSQPDAMCRQLGIEALDIMHPEADDEEAISIAKSVCESCVFIVPCDEWGMAHPKEAGVFGGKTSEERVKIIRNIRREKRRLHGKG